MTKEHLWAAYVAKNPAFNGTGNITMSAAGLKKLFDQTWDKAVESRASSSDKAVDDVMGVFFDTINKKNK